MRNLVAGPCATHPPMPSCHSGENTRVRETYPIPSWLGLAAGPYVSLCGCHDDLESRLQCQSGDGVAGSCLDHGVATAYEALRVRRQSQHTSAVLPGYAAHLPCFIAGFAVGNRQTLMAALPKRNRRRCRNLPETPFSGTLRKPTTVAAWMSRATMPFDDGFCERVVPEPA